MNLEIVTLLEILKMWILKTISKRMMETVRLFLLGNMLKLVREMILQMKWFQVGLLKLKGIFRKSHLTSI